MSGPGSGPDRALRDEVEALREKIRHHDHLYYVKAEPRISDGEYDALFGRLRELEEEFPGLVTDDSPTRRVGAEPREEFSTLDHAAPMLSLDSTRDEAALRRFHERVGKGLGEEAEVEYLLEPKLDGAAIELVYQEGSLLRAVTRGNGWRGEGVTENVKTIPSVPLRLRETYRPLPGFLSVRGEVIMYLSSFEEFNRKLVEGGSDPLANPRNAAAGALRQLDTGIGASRPLALLAYDILAVEGAAFAKDEEVIRALQEWGLPVPERIQSARGIEEVVEYHAAFHRDRDDLDYEIDGIVVKLNDLPARERLGSTSHHPRWALAFKFEPRKEVTRIEKIAVSVGRTGVLTPVALLLPVEVGGVTVSRASLHNREELERKDVREGDLVRIQRAGDVIPQILGRVEEEERERKGAFQMPERCPACRTEVARKGPFTVCPNRFGCPAQLKGRIFHFGSRSALDIEGLGEETAALLVDQGLVQGLADLFDLAPEDLAGLEGFADKSAANLVAAIQRKKRVELARFLFGLGIPEVGVTVAADLAVHFGSLERVRSASREELEEVKGIGPKMSERITEFLTHESNRAAIDAVVGKGMELKVPEGRGGGGLDGISFVFTGGLDSLTRGGAKEAVEGAGGKVVSSVSSATDYVVAGSGTGSKLERATKLGVDVLDEADFLALLEKAGARWS